MMMYKINILEKSKNKESKIIANCTLRGGKRYSKNYSFILTIIQKNARIENKPIYKEHNVQKKM